MSMQGMSNGAEQWCPVTGGFCISEVSFNRGFTDMDFTVHTHTYTVRIYILYKFCIINILCSSSHVQVI